MKGLILSGGKGTRLRPLTYTSSKQLIPVANKPILFYGIEKLIASGVNEIGIVAGDSIDEIRSTVAAAKWGKARIKFIRQPEPLGIAHAVLCAAKFLGRSPFILYLGDNLLNHDLKGFIREFEEKKLDGKILLTKVEDPRLFGVVEFKKNRIVRLVEKPKDPPSKWALCGVYIFNGRIHDIIRKLKPSKRGEYEITEAIQGLLENGYNLGHSFVDGWWKDTGKLEDLLEANRIILDAENAGDIPRTTKVTASRIEGRTKIGKKCVIRNSVLRGPLVIGDDVKINSAYIGPYSAIANGVTLSHCEVENSIVLEAAEIKDIKKRLTDSLIGKNVSILAVSEKPKNNSFMVGDNSRIVLGE